MLPVVIEWNKDMSGNVCALFSTAKSGLEYKALQYILL
jgi:hypothetical protein